jgi:hypothetical protein
VATALAAFTTNGADGSQSMSLQLQPAELGRVQITIDRNADGTSSVTVTAERADTLALLQGDQVQLQHSLDQAGVPAAGRSLVFHLADGAASTATPDGGTGQVAAAGNSNGSSLGGGFGQGGSAQHGAWAAGAGPGVGGGGVGGGGGQTGTALPGTGSTGADAATSRGAFADPSSGAAGSGLGSGLGAGFGERGGQNWTGQNGNWSAQSGGFMSIDGFDDGSSDTVVGSTMVSVQSLGVDIVA